MARLIVWTVAMAYVGFLCAGRGSYFPTSVTVSGALMGAGGGSILALVFTSRSLRKEQSLKWLRRG